MKDDNWITCKECTSEFKIISSVSNELEVEWCPFCSAEIDREDLDIEDEDY